MHLYIFHPPAAVKLQWMRNNILALVKRNFSPSKVNLEQFCDLVKYLLKVRISVALALVKSTAHARKSLL